MNNKILEKFEKVAEKPLNYHYETNFVKSQLIAYIGNKRGLLDLIIKSIEEVETKGSQKINRKGLFIDYFAGSGVVAKLAKSIGYKVIANDWENYSNIINKTFLESNVETYKIFADEGGIDKVIKSLNDLKKFDKKNSYISTYYCPKNDNNPDIEKERMFFTRRNGIIIDNIRAAIEKRYSDNNVISKKKKEILLTSLLYESSVCSNTSGIFKAFHKGFGGVNKDALSRILKTVELKKPIFSEETSKCKVFCEDSIKLSKKLKKYQAEIVYLDPPYNQHQYGSNYHLLNTIALNDQPIVNKEFIIGNKKVNKSAIRKDWKKTKSTFCYKKSAEEDFGRMIGNINSKYILLSYSTEGIINFENMLKIVAAKGKVGIVTSGYVRYRGGRQSNTTKNKNIEFILIVDTGEKSTLKDIENVKGVITMNLFQNLLDEFFPINLKTDCFRIRNKEVILKENNLKIKLNKRLKIDPSILSEIQRLSFKEQNKLLKTLSSLLVKDNDKKVSFIIDLLTSFENHLIDKDYFSNEFIRLYKKINPKKNADKLLKINKKLREIKVNQQNSFEKFKETILSEKVA